MAWQEVEGTKPPLKYDEKEEKGKIDKKEYAEIQQQFAEELKTGIAQPEKDIPPPKPNEVVFDSKRGYKYKK